MVAKKHTGVDAQKVDREVAPEGLGEKVGRGTEAIVHRLLLALSRSWSYATGGGNFEEGYVLGDYLAPSTTQN